MNKKTFSHYLVFALWTLTELDFFIIFVPVNLKHRKPSS